MTERKNDLRSRKRKKRKKGFGAAQIILAALFVVAAAVSFYVYSTFGPNPETISSAELFGSEGERAAILYRNQRQTVEGLFTEGEYYLPEDWVRAILNKRFYWDADERILSYALPDEVLRYDEKGEDRKGRKYLITRDGKTYLSAALVKMYTDVRIEGFSGDGVPRIFAEETPEADTEADAKSKGALRAQPSLRGRVIRTFPKGETFRLLPDRQGVETGPRWQRVRTEDGFTGYIYASRLSESREKPVENSFEPAVYTHIRMDRPVILGWHQVTVKDANRYMEQLADNAEGMNVISPTWYALMGNEGGFEDLSDPSYVKKAHDRGLKVWALIDNLDESVTLGTVLKRTSVRRELIRGLMETAEENGIDGINIDFELLRKDAVPQYLEFMRELSVSCRSRGLVLSVDVPNPASYNAHYDRAELGEICDYVINMGYDEHTLGDEAGSTASIGFFRDGIRESLEEMPKEALICGVPFYTRLWTVKDSQTSSKALTMQGAANWTEEQGVGLNWDESAGQYIAEKENSDGTTNIIWMEEPRSLELKIRAVKESGAAGAAGWRLGTETKEVWPLLQELTK